MKIELRADTADRGCVLAAPTERVNILVASARDLKKIKKRPGARDRTSLAALNRAAALKLACSCFGK